MTSPHAVRFDDLRRALDGLVGLDVLVVGDVLLDDYLSAAGTKLAREAPVPAVTVAGHDGVPGGAGNVAVNLAALGARVRLAGVVGDDEDAARLRRSLAERGVDVTDLPADPGRATQVKRRVVADGQVVFRFDEGSTAPVSAQAADDVAGRLARRLTGPDRPDILIVSDYGCGTITPRVLDRLVGLAGPAVDADGVPVVVDAHDLRRFAGLRPLLVTPNAAEAAALLGRDLDSAPTGQRGADGRTRGDEHSRAERRIAAVRAERARLHDLTGARIVAVTLDRDGTVVCDAGASPYRTYARPAPDRFACGAGDTYASAFALALAAGASVPVAAEVAQAAAAVVTRRDGTTPCTLAELRTDLGVPPNGEPPSSSDTDASGARSLADVAAALDRDRRAGRRVVLTNGCFDLLHRGHVDLLARAKALGDVLVVAVNDDAGVRALKGEGRPVTPLPDRARILAALSCVDHVVAFAEPTATAVVEALRPDVFVKGDDHALADLPEADAVRAVGGQVRVLAREGESSTSSLIERIVDGVPRAGRARPGAGAASDDERGERLAEAG